MAIERSAELDAVENSYVPLLPVAIPLIPENMPPPLE
jgi:hypothetical protein